MDTLTKEREICFQAFHPDANQAHSAMLLLSDIPGIEDLTVISPLRLLVRYHLAYFTLQELDNMLIEVGYHLDNSLLSKLRRALYYYNDETQRANHGCEHGQCKTTRDVFISHYLQRPHGCRDPRPRHWRDYL